MADVADSKTERFKAWMVTNVPLVIASVVVLLFVLIIGSIFLPYVMGWEKTTLLRELSDTHIARGLITFLVAVSTIGIALILTVYMIVTQDQTAKEKFGLAKEVLSALIGVLGTIVGFYFGSTLTTPSQPVSSPTVQVSEIKVNPLNPKPGDVFTLTAEISGGKPPYKYDITFSQDSINAVKGKPSDGKIPEEFTVPKDVKPGTTIKVTIKATDSAGGEGSKTQELKIGP